MRCNSLDEQTILLSLFGNRALYLTLAIEVYLGKHDAYSILNTRQAHLAAAILSCCEREATSCGGHEMFVQKTFLRTPM